MKARTVTPWNPLEDEAPIKGETRYRELPRSHVASALA